MQLSGFKKCLNCMKGLVKTEGFISLYRSLPITMFMNAPYAITTVTVNENMKKIIEPKKRRFKFLSYFLCAAFAGGVASIVTCPFDNIKTKLQTQSTMSSCEVMEGYKKSEKCGVDDDRRNRLFNEKEGSSVKYKNIHQTVISIYKDDGFRKGFFKGIGPRILFNSPSCAISWASYEFMKHGFFMLEKYNSH